MLSTAVKINTPSWVKNYKNYKTNLFKSINIIDIYIMKRFFTLFTTVVVILYAHAQEHVYYLLPSSLGWNCEQVTDVNDNKTIGDDANQLKWEYFEWTTGNPDYSPERRAYTWFRGTYCDGIPDSYFNVRHVITFEDLLDGRLEANGDLFPNVRVLWVNVDRNMSKDDFDALFPSNIYTKLANFVKAGGNLYLSTFASRLVWLMGRMNAEPGFDQNNGIDGNSADWYVRAHFDSQDNHEHAVYKYVSGYNSTSGNFPMLSGSNHTNRNCLWEGDYSAFQTSHTCKVLGSWGHDGDKEFKSEGLVGFYPTGDWKGTIICNGLAACSFAPTNGQIANVQNLTKGILNYLSAGDFTISAKETPVIKEEENITVINPNNLTIRSYSTSNALIANIHNVGDPGHIYYNYFGDVTFIVIAEGDGINTPKSVRATCKRTVIGGTPAQYAYVLPYSMETISETNYDDGTNHNIPDFLSALWFYEHYIKEGRTENYGNGCFINPKNYSSSAAIPSEIQVLWVHNDHVGLVSDTYRDDLGCQIDPYEFYFKDALRAFINRGGNVFLSKQATRLLGDLGRVGFPSYANDGYTDTYAEDWGIKNKFFGTLGSETYDLSSHPVYTTPNNLGGNPQLIDATNHTWRTNNNCILFDEKTNNTEDGYLSYQTTHNCKLLGSWNNGGIDYQAGVFAEFLPQGTGQGTIIMLGAAAYQWTCGTQTAILENVHANVKNLTQNILEYLAAATVVVTEPDTEIPSMVNDLVVYQGGSVSNTGNITIRNSITYIRPAEGGAASNELGHWYTFCLPFTPSAVKVLDEDDGFDYDINSVYMNAGDAENNPQGAGHFYLQTFDYYDGEDTHWAYIGNYGMPTQYTPYIIKFIDADEDKAKGDPGLATYFDANPVIKFIGGPQVISGTDDGTGGAPNGDYTYHVNHTLRKLKLSHVYPLNTATNMFEYDYGGSSEIMPFECYIKASTRALAAARPRFAIGRGAQQGTEITTAVETVAAPLQPLRIYDVTGRLFYTGDEPRQLPQGIWIVRQGEKNRTIVIP